LFVGLAALVALPSFLAPTLLCFVPFYLAIFFFIGAVEPLLQSKLSAEVTPARRGLLMGLVTTSGSLAWSVSPMAGSAVAIFLGIRYVFLFLSIFLFITFAVCLLWRWRTART